MSILVRSWALYVMSLDKGYILNALYSSISYSHAQNINSCLCRVKKGTYFLPELFHIKFELEDSKLNDGNQAAFGYSHVIFPDFTWKGYVTFGDDQVN